MKAAGREWEPWQHEYEHGAFLILPPEDVAVHVNWLRRQHDPKSADICDAHVTLSEPLLAPLTSSQIDELTAAVALFRPIEFRFGPITDMGHPPGVVYEISPPEPFFELRRTIHQTSAFSGHRLARADRQPHMTIAEFITVERTAELLHELRELPTGSFLCDSVVLMVPNHDYHFSPVLSIPFSAD